MKKELPRNIYDQIRSNRWRTGALFLMFPLIILGLTYLGILLAIIFSSDPELVTTSPIELANMMMRTIGFWVIVAVFIYSAISYFAGSKMIMGYAGAKPIKKRDNPTLYNAVENISITAGMAKTPEIYIIEDQGLNAFATGTHPDNAKIAITRGLLEKLSKAEMEAVMAHEMGHVLNRDIRVMLIVITLLGSIQIIGEMMLRTAYFGGRSRSRGSGIIPLIGFLFITVGVLMGMLTKFAISREREYLADATGAFLTSNPLALASALEKISANPGSQTLGSKPTIGSICIEDPTIKKSLSGEKKQSFWKKIWSTHPPASDRIRLLQRY